MTTEASTQGQPAVFSEDRRYRYLLNRRVGLSESQCLFIMLNPSTADETQDDPTIRRCIGFAQQWGFGILTVANIFALRSTDPKRLRGAGDAVGQRNDYYIMVGATEADRVICAWGNHGLLCGRGKRVIGMLHDEGIQIQHLGLTKQGEPKHPLYLSKTTEPEVF